jgi:MFS family permease
MGCRRDGASGLVPIALALVGDLVPFAQRGRVLGWLFGGIAVQAALLLGFSTALVLFGLTALAAAALDVPLFATERPHSAPARRPG